MNHVPLDGSKDIIYLCMYIGHTLFTGCKRASPAPSCEKSQKRAEHPSTLILPIKGAIDPSGH